MGAVTEGQDARRAAVDVEAVGIVELALVAVARRVQEHDAGAGLERLVAELEGALVAHRVGSHVEQHRGLPRARVPVRRCVQHFPDARGRGRRGVDHDTRMGQACL